MKWTNFLNDTNYQNSTRKIDPLNRPISVKGTESIINSPSLKEAPGPDGITS